MHHKVYYQTFSSGGAGVPLLRARNLSLVLLVALATACVSSGDRSTPRPTNARPADASNATTPLDAGAPANGTAAQGAEPIGRATDPASAPTNWKERIAQPYVFLERIGDYRQLGTAMRELLALAESGAVTPNGPPFALFYDDPAQTPVDRLRAQVCLPVAGPTTALPVGVSYAVLPRAMVVYSRVAGAYPDVPRVYPTLIAYMQQLGWTAGGPIREIYLVNPAAAESSTYDELVTEVQIPWSSAGG